MRTWENAARRIRAATDSSEYPYRLLVVDDEPNIVELLDTSLRYVGFEVVTATTGREAVTATSEFTPDLIVLDVMLPHMDGFETR